MIDPRLYILMPIRNEVDRYLVPVLESFLSFTPNVFIYDDQSSDGSAEVAAAMGAEVAIRPDNVPSFVQHEGAFRQGSWNAFQERMKPEPRSWILAADADEVLWGLYPHRVSLLSEQSTWDVLGITFVHMWNETHYRVDKAWKPHLSSRLFRYYPGGEYLQRPLASGAEPLYVQELIAQGKALWETGLIFQHLGYARPEDRIAKYQRYSELDGGSYHARAHIESILDTTPTLVPWTGSL